MPQYPAIIHKTLIIVTFLHCIAFTATVAQHHESSLDVISYRLQLEPDISKQYLKGSVSVHFLTKSPVNEVTFDYGSSTVTEVKGNAVESFRQEDKKLIITFSGTVNTQQQVQIFYHGSPTRGVVFSTEPPQGKNAFYKMKIASSGHTHP